MKIILLVVVTLIYSTTFSQKITQDEIDKFTKQRRIETSSEKFKNHIGGAVGAYIRSVDSTCFIVLKGFGSYADVIGTDDRLIFLLDNDETVSAYSTTIQSYEIGYGKSPKSFSHQYRIDKAGIEELSQHNLKSIRRYGSSGYMDIDISEKKNDEFKKVAALFLATLSK